MSEDNPIIPPLLPPTTPPVRRPLAAPGDDPREARACQAYREAHHTEQCIAAHCPRCRPEYQDRVSGPPRAVDGPGCTPAAIPRPAANNRVSRAYDELKMTREGVQEAFVEGDQERFDVELSRYTSALLTAVRVLQSPMHGPRYTVDPTHVAPDDFLDASISWEGRKDYAVHKMEQARRAR